MTPSQGTNLLRIYFFPQAGRIRGFQLYVMISGSSVSMHVTSVSVQGFKGVASPIREHVMHHERNLNPWCRPATLPGLWLDFWPGEILKQACSGLGKFADRLLWFGKILIQIIVSQ